MRAILLTLIVVNLGYFAYRQYIYSAPAKVIVADVLKDVESIYLLRENSNGRLREEELGLIVNNPVVAVQGGEQNCDALGPFADVFAGQNVVDRFDSTGLQVDLKALDSATKENDYRVMIPPASSLQEAFRKLTELKLQEIDSYVITKGDDSLGISLGVFSTESAAITAQSGLKELGYDAGIVAISRVLREFWIFSSGVGKLEVSDQMWLSIRENNPEVELRAQQCQET